MKKLLVFGLLVCAGMTVYGMTEEEAKESFNHHNFKFGEKEEQLSHLRKVREQCPQFFSTASDENSFWKMKIIRDLVYGGNGYVYDVAILKEFLSYDPNLIPNDWNGMHGYWSGMHGYMKQEYKEKKVSEEQFSLLMAYLERIKPSDDDNTSESEHTLEKNEAGEEKFDPIEQIIQTDLDDETARVSHPYLVVYLVP